MKSIRIHSRKRFLKVAAVFIGILLDFTKEYSLIKKSGYSAAQKRMKTRHEKRARQLYDTAISMQGVMIKLCQFFSARRDFFPESYVSLLSTLQDNVPPVPFDEIRMVIEGEYGDHRKYFKEIDPIPVASASLGQVHRAILQDGTTVVLKILKPGIERIIDIDFAILHFVFKILSGFRVFRERADLFHVLDEFIRVTGDELNFRREAWVAMEFRRLLEGYDYVSVPLIYSELSNARIIVMESLTGDKVSDVNSWKDRSNDPVLLSRRIIGLYMDQLLKFGLVHFDPHPGNILVESDSRFSLIDFGMSGIITPRMRQGLLKALRAFIKRNGRAFIDALDELGFIRKNVNRYSMLTVIDFFLNEFIDIFTFDREAIQTMDFSPIREELIELLYTQPFNIPYEWAFVGKTIGILAGIISTLNPQFNVYEELKPYADTYLSRNAMAMARESFSFAKETFGLLLGFPSRIDVLIDSIERGHLRFKVDYTEMLDKIDEVKAFVIRTVGLLVSMACMISLYVFFVSAQYKVSIMFAGIAAAALVFSLLYRKRSSKDRLRRYI